MPIQRQVSARREATSFARVIGISAVYSEASKARKQATAATIRKSDNNVPWQQPMMKMMVREESPFFQRLIMHGPTDFNAAAF